MSDLPPDRRGDESMRPLPLLAALGVGLLGCPRPPRVAVDVQVEIPADVPTSAPGELQVRLWDYDPGITDFGPGMVAVHTTAFSHTSGQRDVFQMHVGGPTFWGAHHFITVQACVGEDEVLWDGLPGRAAPRVVVMQPRVPPIPCITSPAVRP